MKKLCFLGFVLLVACATSSGLRKSETVTLLLNNGDKIKAQVMQITADKVTFKARSVKKAYEYGEVLPRARIQGVKLRDGSVVSVAEYAAQRTRVAQQSTQDEEPAGKRSRASVRRGSAKSPEAQFAQLKKMPVSEMTENEFQFFMMMLEKELQAGEQMEALKPRVPVHETPADAPTLGIARARAPIEEPPDESRFKSRKPDSRRDEKLQDAVNSMVDAGLATRYLQFLQKKTRAGMTLSTAEAEMKALIQSSTRWRENLEDLEFLNRTAMKVMSRVYLFTPEELQTKLNLNFDPDAEMDFQDLMSQLHRSMGEHVRIVDYRKLVDVFGEGGGRTMKEILQRYADLQFVLSPENVIVTK